jgi:hypothetical protein
VLLDDDVADALGIGARRTVDIKMPGAEEASKEQAVSIGSILIGDAMFSDFEGIVIDYDKVYGGKRERDGTIGFPLFHGCLLTVDYVSGVVRMEPGELPMINDGDILGYMLDEGVPTIEAEIQLMPHRFVVDTGRAGAMTLPEWLKDKLKLRYREERSFVKDPATSPASVREVQVDSTLQLGMHRILEPPVHFFGEESAIGHKTLQNFVLTFDSKNERVRFFRESTGAIDFQPTPKFGLYFRREGGKFVVTKVLANSPAGVIGIQVGDLIINIDGKPSTAFTEGALRNLFTISNTVAMQLERNGYPYILRLNAPEE